MARSRNIKPGLAKNEVLAEMGPESQLLFALLPCHADREGRLEDRPKRIKAEIFPYYEVDVDSILDQLADCEEQFIIRYEIDGKRYIQITNFDSHQSPHHKENESMIPACSKQEPSKGQARAKHDNPGSHAPVKGISNKVKGISNKLEAEFDFLNRLKSLDGFCQPRGDVLTGKRRQSFRKRLDEDIGGETWYDAMLEALGKFPLQCSQAGNWKPDVEWLLRPDSVTKVLEGKYDFTPNGQEKAKKELAF